MNKNSNVTVRSNIYILNESFETDIKFQSMVHGRNSLEKMLKVLAELKWVKENISLDRYTCRLSDVQKQEWKLGMHCALLGDKEEIVWGLVKDNNDYRIECRCYRMDCRHFSSCRPDYVPGQALPVSVPTKKQDETSRMAKVLSLPVSALGKFPTFALPVDAMEDEIVKIHIPDEPEIPHLEQIGIREEKEKEADPIITAGVEEKMLVLAGPGTGKTYSLLRKLVYAIDEKGMVEADSVLLLCFTRAAVKEIRERFQAGKRSDSYSDDLSRLDIRTFDSFATLVLLEREIDFSGHDYDDRIERVIKEIENHPDTLVEMKHFLVDEIQDLVGVRARLVCAILKNRPDGCGFTLLGDPHQAIYDYSVKDQPEEMNSRDFLRWLHQEYREELKQHHLIRNRRQTGSLAAIANRARSILDKENPEEIREFFGNLKSIFQVENEIGNIAATGDSVKRVAILCRNNGEVLKISGYLRQLRVAHNLRRQYSRFLLPAWIAGLLEGRRYLTSDDPAIQSLHGQGVTKDPGRFFSLLHTLSGNDGPGIDREKLRQVLAGRTRLPDDLYEGPAFPLTVSTVHQAKGREYDRVYLVEPQNVGQADDLLEEGRVYYVALTRARRDFKLFAPRRENFTWLQRITSGRWIEAGKKRDSGNKRMVGLEIGMDGDIDDDSFIDKNLQGFEPEERQKYILENMSAGDPLEIILLDEDTGNYGIFHHKKLIGLMSAPFTAGVREAMNDVYVRTRYIPIMFTGIYVERIYSVVRKPETVSRNAGACYLDTGVWYGVNVAGMGKARFFN